MVHSAWLAHFGVIGSPCFGCLGWFTLGGWFDWVSLGGLIGGLAGQFGLLGGLIGFSD